MFTGIIEELGRVETVRKLEGAREFTVACSFAGQTSVDESVSVNGACMTVTDRTSDCFTFQSVPETLRKTTLADLTAGDRVNLERAMTLDKALEGHMVQGHVDTTGRVERVVQEGDDRLVDIRYPESLETLVVGRGSVAVNGVSLTVAEDMGGLFRVAIIPHTWSHTTFHLLQKGSRVNIEFDLFGKYITKYLDRRFGQSPPSGR